MNSVSAIESLVKSSVAATATAPIYIISVSPLHLILTVFEYGRHRRARQWYRAFIIFFLFTTIVRWNLWCKRKI